MNAFKKILILSFSHLEHDPRVYRQIKFLRENYKIIAAGLNSPNIDDVTFISLSSSPKSLWQKGIAGMRLLSGDFEKYYWESPRLIQAVNALQHVQPDMIIANDIETLPLACRIAQNAPIIFDAHEYAPKEFEDSFIWRLFYKKYKTYLCKEYLPKAVSMLTVSSGIAHEYSKQFNVNPHVVTNAPEFAALSPQPVKEEKIRLVCHSYAVPSRKLELLIGMFDFLDPRFEMNLILMPFSKAYLKKLKTMAKKHPRIHLLPPVPMKAISAHLNQYDVGVYLLPPNSFNNAFALPNKLFEFIQARLAVAIGPSSEMASIVSKYQCGIISSEFTSQSLAQALNALDRKTIEDFKKNAAIAAADLCAENNKHIILNIVSEALKI